MSDKPEKKEAPAAPAAGDEKKAAEGGGGGGFLTKLPVLLGGVMVIEAAVLFAGFKMFGGKPQPAAGANLVAGEGGDGKDGDKGGGKKGKTLEISVGDFKALNLAHGHTLL